MTTHEMIEPAFVQAMSEKAFDEVSSLEWNRILRIARSAVHWQKLAVDRADALHALEARIDKAEDALRELNRLHDENARLAASALEEAQRSAQPR